MNYDESAKVLTKVLVGFPSCRWTQDQEHEFLHELVVNGLDFQVALLAVGRHKAESDFAPSWHQFLDAYRFVRDDLQRAADAARALTAPKDENEAKQRRVNVAGLRLVRQAAERFAGANLTPNGMGLALDFTFAHGMRGHRHNRGAEHCPVCKRHDHKDMRTIGFATSTCWTTKLDGSHDRIEQKEPIPAWHLTCPRCGVTDFVDLVCDTWTPLGSTMMRERNQPPPTRQLTGSDF